MRNLLAFAAAQLVLAFMLWSVPACNTLPDPKHVAEIVIDCTVDAVKARIDALVDTLRPLLNLQRPKVAEAFSIAKDAGKEIGGCALARVTQEIMSNRGAPPDTEAGFALSTTLERFRVEVAGGEHASFEVELDGRKVRL